MRRLDRYVISEVLPAFILGVGLFAALLVSFDVVSTALKQMVKQNIPGLLVLESLAYRLPQVIAFTLPMATMFASLTCFARMGSDGELTAMRAGGIGFPRIIVSVAAFGLCVSLFGLAFNELVVPHCNWDSDLALVGFLKGSKLKEIVFNVNRDGHLKQLVYAQSFDASHSALYDVSITVLQEGRSPQWVTAKKAVWRADAWVLYDVIHQSDTPDGKRHTEVAAKATYNIGKSPEDLLNLKRDTEDMTVSELKAQADKKAAAGEPYEDEIMEINQRLALPFSAFGFALMAAPLGIRPQRTSKSLGFGLSLVIVLAYFIVFQVLRVVGVQGGLAPAVAAWGANAMLFLIGAGLLMEKSR
jgi:lipopolysaccharide export system permease protein